MRKILETLGLVEEETQDAREKSEITFDYAIRERSTVGIDFREAYDRKTEKRRRLTSTQLRDVVDNWCKCIKHLNLEILNMKEVMRETTNLVELSMYDSISEKEVRDFLCAVIHDKSKLSLSGAIGSLVGLVVSDALGHWFEFMDVVDLPPDHGAGFFDSRSFKFTAPLRNKFMLKPGQWTDDSSMALCMADSLITNLSFDGSDIRVRFWNWWYRGYCNAFRRDDKRKNKASVGLGGNISKSLLGMDPHTRPPSRVRNSGRNDSGNGSLMRLAPISIFFADDSSLLLNRAALSSLSTHPGREAVEACKFLAFLTSRAIGTDSSSTSIRAFLDESIRVYLRDVLPPDSRNDKAVTAMRRLLIAKEPVDSLERNWNWRELRLYIRDTLHARIEASSDGTYNGDHPVSLSYFGAYCMDGLAVALHSLYHTRSFSKAVERCVNFMGDADTTAAICGQICGAFYGIESIDPRFLELLLHWDNGDCVIRAVLLYELGKRNMKKRRGDEKNNVPLKKKSEVVVDDLV